MDVFHADRKEFFVGHQWLEIICLLVNFSVFVSASTEKVNS
ncbi:hypothetical protein HMPREF1555_00090 [Porphyromonas gingivalis F0570]|uniref:Uncharacterized protein n=1 Tax=Porphyromonas gingivalis F0570 TaxID=1227271 RepID=A0A0E2LTR8_PORGN|nr:hypothetical protein HMPREF1555_00090 [Porphyromonas gingivalis F0570]